MASRQRQVEVATLVLLIVLTVFLVAEVRALRKVQAEFALFRAFPFVGQYTSIEQMPTLAGTTVTLGQTEPGGAQVVFALTTSCPFCRQSLVEWSRIRSELARESSANVDVYWLSLSSIDSTRAYASEHGLDPARVLLPSSPRMPQVYRIKGGPLTLVYDSDGRVAYSRPALLVGKLAGDSVISAARSAAQHSLALPTVTAVRDTRIRNR